MKTLRIFVISILLSTLFSNSFAQPHVEIELKKPVKYENRKLKSERTGEKKFTLPKRIIQNTVTHYNYFFNANTRLNEVITQAKTAFKDDYGQLLPFYNYTLQATAQNKTELDSIIYKCTAGILLHDLRNDWIDDMYLLLGKTYMFRNDLDSAGMTFQYLNFSFAPKEEGGYDIPIGSNASSETGEFSIATKEKDRNFWAKLTNHKPSRNESFVWQIRNHIEKDELPEAAGIIEILRNDPNFPKRLDTELNEMVAYWFYKQNVYDSAAYYLSRSLNEATNKQETARWEYLIGQLYQLSGDKDEAVKFYERSIKRTIDPIMEVYARLNIISVNRGGNENVILANIAELEKMAKRDKYENYRDIIYYAAANMQLERKDFDAAQKLLLQSVKYTVDNPGQRSASFMLLGDINYDRKAYTFSSAFYDSTDGTALRLPEDRERLALRKPPLKIIVQNEQVINMEDSVQALAVMPAAEREAQLRKTLRQLRKLQGLREDESSANPAVRQEAKSLFGDNKSGDFYFYNPSLKSRGFTEFRSKWGDRPNVDNWRRIAAVNKVQVSTTVVDVDSPTSDTSAVTAVTDISYEGLLARLPMDEAKMEASNKKIMDALYTEGKTFIEKLEDYDSGIAAFEELLRRFPGTTYTDEAYFYLAFAYDKRGDVAKAEQNKKRLLSNPGSKWAKQLQDPTGGKAEIDAAATARYQQIYNLFIEGNFERAKTEKKAADSLYGNSYWTPQLLFIESIYYIKQREDSTAIKVLNSLMTLHSSSVMAPKAQTMIDVLRRRNEIENYLAKLEVKRNVDVAATPSPEKVVEKPQPPVVKKEAPVTPVNRDTATTVAQTPVIPPAPATTQLPAKTDTVPATAVVTPPAAVKSDTIANTTAQTKVPLDTVAAEQPPVATIIKKDTAANTIATVTPVDTASVVVVNKPATDTVAVPDTSTVIARNETPVDTATSIASVPPAVIEPAKVPKDTVATVPAAPAITVGEFTFAPADPHYVVIVLDKVDPVYASEARNAFNRYNRERHYNQNIEVTSLTLDERFNLVLQGPFADAAAAVDYIDKTQPVTRSRILPWLTAEKYSFITINHTNLQLLKNNKNMEAYKLLLQKAFPGKF